jgi:hypothetical protein
MCALRGRYSRFNGTLRLGILNAPVVTALWPSYHSEKLLVDLIPSHNFVQNPIDRLATAQTGQQNSAVP